MTAETRSLMSVPDGRLFVAFELGKKDWKLAMTSGFGVKPVMKTVPSGDWVAVERALAAGRSRLALGSTAGRVAPRVARPPARGPPAIAGSNRRSPIRPRHPARGRG